MPTGLIYLHIPSRHGKKEPPQSAKCTKGVLLSNVSQNPGFSQYREATYKPARFKMIMLVVKLLDRWGYTANDLCWHRIKMAPIMCMLMVMTIVCPSGFTKVILFVSTLLFCTEVWLTDLWDGHLARLQQKRLCEEQSLGYFTMDPLYPLNFEQRTPWSKRLKLKGITNTGQTIDPIGDKESYVLCALPLLLFPAMLGSWKLMVATFVYEFVLYLMRPIKDWLKLNDKAAKGPGKLKVNIEWISLAILFVIGIGDQSDWWTISEQAFTTTATVLFSIILLLQTASFVAHLVGARRSHQYNRAKKMMERIRGES